MKKNEYSRQASPKKQTTAQDLRNEKLRRNVDYINDSNRDNDGMIGQNEVDATEQGKEFKEVTRHTRAISEKSFFKGVKDKVLDFLKTKAKDVTKSAKKLYKDIVKDFVASKNPKAFAPGNMVAFTYNARDTKKRFDKKPLAISLGWSQQTKGNVIMLNMHWMPMKDRVALAGFFASLAERRGGELTYDDVKPFMKKFKGQPILRMYIYKRISGKVIVMPKDQFMVASAIDSAVWMGGK